MTDQHDSGGRLSDRTNPLQSDSSFEIEKLGPGDHLCYLYQTDQEHRELLTRFIRLGLERNEKVLYIVDAHSAKTVKGYLQEGGVDVAKYVESGQFAILNVSESYMLGGVFNPDMMIELLKSETEKALNDGYAVLRVTAEMTWALRGFPGSERLLEYEAKLNEFLPESKALVICQYDCRRFEPTMLLEVLATHPIVAMGAEVYDNFSYVPPDQFLSSDRDGVLLDRWLENLKKAKAHKKPLERSYQSLRTERERFAVTLRSIGDGVITTDAEGRVLVLNKVAEKLTGWPEQEALGRSAQEVFHIVDEKTREGSVNPVQTVLETGEKVAFAHDPVLVARDGAERILEGTAAPIQNEAEDILGVVLVFKDVTERNRLHKEIQEREKRFRGLLERLPEAAYRMSLPDGTYEYFSPASKSVFGYSAEEFLGEPLFISRIVHSDFAEYFADVWADLLRGKVAPTYEYKVIDPAGNERWIMQSNTGIFDATGRIVAIEGVCSDITELKRAEAALHLKNSAMESSISGISIVDLDGKITYANPAALRLWGYDHEEEILGKQVLEFWITNKEAEEAVQIGAKTGAWIGELVARRKDGSPLDVQAAVTLVRDSDGTPIAVMGSFLDISDRKRAEEAILRAKEEWESTFDAVPELICILDENNRILRANRAMADAMGVSPEEAVGRLCYEVIHGTDSPPEFCPHQRLLSEGGLHEAELYEERLGGHLHVSVSPVSDSEGGATRCVHVIRNISEQKKAEEALRENEYMMRSILVATPVGLVLTENHVIKWANEEWEKMFGFKDEAEYVGKPTSIMFTSQGQYMTARQAVYDNLENGILGETYTEFMRKDGALFEAYLRTTYLDPSHPSRGILNAISDLSEIMELQRASRESEERYRVLFEDSRDAVYVTTRDGKFVDVNQAFCQLFGFERHEFEKLRAVQAYTDPAHRIAFQEAIEKTGSIQDFPLQFRKRDGTVFDALLTASVRYGKKGEILGYQGIVRDVTEQKKLENQLLQAQKMESIGNLAGGIAHDFNNLLTVVQGYAEVLLADKDNTDADYNDLQTIRHAANRGADLVKQILTFSRNIETKPRPIDLNHEVRRAQELLYRTIPKMIEIELLLANDLKRVFADASQIEQVILNLGLNAKDAMPEGGKLTIGTENVTLTEEYCKSLVDVQPGEYVMLTASDTGHGIEKEVLEHIFEPFYSTKKPGEGTGLGLAMVFGIVKGHGGHITCYSEQGVGTTFRLYFPVHEAELKEDLATTKEMEAYGDETILLVDDEELIRDLGKRILTQRGFTVLTADNGTEALKAYREKKDDISLVILDMIMPVMGGNECLHELLNIDPDVKVLISSGFTPDATARETLESGAKGFVTKPFRVGKLVQAVRRVLDET